jgi:hypothetical protein
MPRARYSFVIPAYNDAPGIARHLEFFARAGQEVELVIVDDCAPAPAEGPTIEAIVAGAALPPNVALKYHRNAVNRGAGPSRNTGLEMAGGEFIMFLDGDDLLADCFFDYIGLTTLGRGADFVLFKYHLCETEAERYSYTMHEIDNQFFSNMAQSGFPAKSWLLEEIPSALRTINYPWNKIYTHDFLKGSGISFPDFRMHEDIQPHWQSFLRAGRFGVLNWAPPLIHHFESPTGSRATNYIGEHRMHAFETLLDVQKEASTHPAGPLLLQEFAQFCDQLFTWMGAIPGIEGSAENRGWRERYAREAERFRRDMGWRARPQATPMGQILARQSRSRTQRAQG